MESSILHELAAFDTKAPINFTIFFEDNNESDANIAVKTENVLDDNTCQDKLLDSVLEPKKEIKEEPTELCETIEEQPNKETEEKTIELQEKHKENSDTKIEEEISKETTTLQTDSLKNSRAISDDSRKRKQTQLQIYKNKTAKNSTTLEISNHLASHDNEKETNKGSNGISYTNSAHQDAAYTSQLNPPLIASTASIPSTKESEKERISSFIMGCLTSLSEYMRLIMEAFLYHKQCNIPYETFKKHKLHYFQACYGTVVKILLPERQNKEFIRLFLLQTYQHASRRSGHNKGCVQDYATLLKELLDWATETEKQIAQAAGKKENTVQPTRTGVQEQLVTEHARNKLEAKNSDASEKTNTICIYSSGTGGNEITISVDPSVRQYLSEINNYNNNRASVIHTPTESSNDLQQPQMSLNSQPATQANNKNKHLQELLQQPPLIRPTAPSLPDVTRTVFQNLFQPEIYKGVKGNSVNNDISPKQINKRSPQVKKRLKMQNKCTMPGQSPQLPQSKPSQQISPQYQQIPHVLPEFGQPQTILAPAAYGQSTRGLPPPYSQSTPVLPPWQYLQPHLGNSQHAQSKYRQQFGQPQHNMLSQYGQVQSEIGQLQNVQPQYSQLQMVQSHPILPQSVSHVSPQIRQSQSVLPEYEQPLQAEEWQQCQALNEPYQHQGPAQPQVHRSAPRSASTDSGFISPLNFNASSSTDQTVPPAATETETPALLITHVTSLNPQVAYMAEGSCVVCSKTTKKVCMGCMKIYYCTYECQLQDWHSHGPDCNNIRIMAQLTNNNNAA